MTQTLLEQRRHEHLRKSLLAFETHVPEEQRFRTEMLSLLARGPRAFSRDHHVPGHFTASAFVLDPSRQHLLLIHHAKLGRWLQPGGHIEPADSDVVASAAREVQEETGVSVRPESETPLFDLDVHPIPERGPVPAHLHFDVRLLFQADSTTLAPSDEVLAARWLPLETLLDDEHDASVRRAARKLRAAR